MKLEDWLKQASAKLKLADIPSWHQDAKLIAMHHLNLASTQLILADFTVPEVDLNKLNLAIKRRLKMEPLAYVLGEANFYGRDFIIDDRVLIPRPETENLIDFILSLKLEEPKLVDVGTGSGIIGLTLACEIFKSEINMLDISSDCLEVARINSERLRDKVDSNNSILNFKQSDLLADCEFEPLDLIVANLPYVDISWDWLDLKSLSFEPSLALWAEDSGLSLVKKLIDQSSNHLKPGGHLVLEVDPSQKEKVKIYGKDVGFKPIRLEPKFGQFIVVFRI